MGKNEMINIRYYDVLNPDDEDEYDGNMSGDEIAADVIKRAGLVVQ